ncbi:transglutaminase domain-containing protein [Lentzea tibetensis]|uniref:Transglutaminase domain-containing protein n=1 Tax=Lentzea tibetensis TaxID=2591470 RepID=A0A563F241_9PSEU|nr:transglutaminase domain-containing protein [Lentzea tibetensis]TWP54056.1 transglutaminase domain-containing protein [Lentzea tibetensis]
MNRLVPARADLVDAGFLALLFVVALIGFRTTYTGWVFLLAGTAGLVLGVLVGHVATALRQPMITVALMTAAVFFLLGGAVVLREQAAVGFLPTPSTVAGLADLGGNAWKQLLTTLPPVDGTGPLLVIPYVLGLLCGSGGFTLARRVSLTAAPVCAPLLVLTAVILLGTGEPVLLQGAVFGVAALCWTSVRAGRRRTGGSARLARALTALVLLGVSAGASGALGVLLPADTDRVVLRNYVDPPFEIGAYASPLVGFRKHTKDANQLWDQTLFTVHGLPAGERVRIATLDAYDGSVWGATSSPSVATNPLERNSFQRIGTRIPVTAGGAEATVTVTVGAAYTSADELSAWLPVAGHTTAIDFSGDGREAHVEHLRYNLATSSGIVADRLRAGDTYTITTVLGSPRVPDDAQPFGRPNVDGNSLAFVRAKATKWVGDAGSIAEKLRAAAQYLRENGAYTDGGPGESEFLPGHSTGRLTSFFNANRPAGNDEQYAAAYALIANQVGMPARVVLGAMPGEDGVVRGEHVQAWVEIHLADGTWAAVPNTEFMPDRSKRPDRQPPQEIENTDASSVPPPNTMKLPSSLTDANQVDAQSNRRLPDSGAGWRLPAWVITALTWTGPPVLGVAWVLGAIIGLKARRRRRRRTRGTTALRFATGWRELVDHARDLGAVVPRGLTRPQEAAFVGHGPLAGFADRWVFGPEEPPVPIAEQYWSEVDAARRGMSRGVGRWRRWRAAVDPRSLWRGRS